MNDFTLCTPTRFIFKRGAVDCVGEAVASAGFKNALLVYGQGSVVRNGLLGRVKGSLIESGVAVSDLAGVRPNPEVTSVRFGIDFGRAKGVDVVIALGGGSAIDCAKAIAVGIPYEGDVWDFFERKLSTSDVAPLPVVAVLTIPAAGSEASDSCVISNDALGHKRGINGDVIRPKIAVMDPEVTCTLPPYQTAAGVTDMIAHICERWFSGVGAIPVTDNIAAGVIRSAIDAARVVMKEPCNLDARATLMWASTLAHNGLCGAGRSTAYGKRAGGWESHALEHELSALDPAIAHGAGLAVIMPAWMRYVKDADPSRFELFGQLVFGMSPETGEAPEEFAEKVIDKLQAFFVEIGMPSTMDELGLAKEDVDKLLPTLEHNKGPVLGAFKKINMEDARAIYLSAFK